MTREPLVARWTVHPLLPALTSVLCGGPFVGWAWLAVNAYGMRGARARWDVAVLVVAFFGVCALQGVSLLWPADEAWLGWVASVWSLAGTMLAFSWQRRRYDAQLAVDAVAGASEAPGPTPEDEHVVDTANRLLDHGWAFEAEVVARRATEELPDDADAWIVLGDVQRALDRPAEAELAYRRAIGLAPDDPDAALGLASAARSRGDVQVAERALRDAIARWPDDEELLLELAHLFLEEGRAAEAETVARHLGGLAPHDAEALAVHADALVRQGHLDAGAELASQALARDPEQALARHALGGSVALRFPVVADWYRHQAWLSRVGRGWALLPWLLAFAMYRLGPVIEHPGPARAGVALAVIYAVFGVGGFVAYHVGLYRRLEELGIEE